MKIEAEYLRKGGDNGDNDDNDDNDYGDDCSDIRRPLKESSIIFSCFVLTQCKIL